MKKKIVFIMNPISGTSSKAAIPSLIESTLNKELFEYEIRMTERAGHASEIATEAKDNHVDIVVAVGGDGTINEVARSIVHSDTALGIIPCGSGNGLARHLLIPMNLRKALRSSIIAKFMTLIMESSMNILSSVHAAWDLTPLSA